MCACITAPSEHVRAHATPPGQLNITCPALGVHRAAAARAAYFFDRGSELRDFEKVGALCMLSALQRQSVAE